ncbi:MAG: ABC transporter ATP-binding protein, partial [Actinomycetota bacterium]
GNRVCVLKKGELQQVGTPTELFEGPRNLFVAGFIGSPSMNFASATLDKSNGGYSISLGDQTLKLSDKLPSQRPGLEAFAGKELIIGIRPNDFEDVSVAGDAPDGSRLKVNIDLVEHIGTETMVHFQVDAPIAVTEDMKELAADVGGEEMSHLEQRAKEGKNEFVAQLDPRTSVRARDSAELVVNTDRFHFFDTDSSQGIYEQ